MLKLNNILFKLVKFWFWNPTVKYVERIDPSIKTQITAYPTAVEGFKSVNFSDSQLALSNGGGAVGNNEPTLINDDKTMQFDGKKILKFANLGFKTITFKCERDGQSETVTIKPGLADGYCNVDKPAFKDLFGKSHCKNGFIVVLQTEISVKLFKISDFKGKV